VIVADAEIGATMRLAPNVTADGLISFAVTKVRGQVEASGIKLFHRSDDGRARALNGTNADIGASFLLDDATIEGRIDIAGARIGGRLSFIGATLRNRTADSIGKAVEAGNVTVGSDVEFGHSRYDRTQSGQDTNPLGANIGGTLDLTGAKIGGNLAFIATTLENPPPPPPKADEQALQIGYALAGIVDVPPARPSEAQRFLPNSMGIALIARQVQVQASVLLIGGFSSDGALLLTGGTIGRDLICHHATLHNPRRSALYAKDIEIGDDLKLISTTAIGDLRFERASIGGSVAWENLSLRAARASRQPIQEPSAARHHTPDRGANFRRRLWWRARTTGQCLRANACGFVAWSIRCFRTWRNSNADEVPAEWPRIPHVDLSHARIGTSLRCAHLLQESPSQIDLTGLRVTTLDLTHVHGWGRTEGPERHYPIAFDLLVYDRLIFPTRPTKHEPYTELRTAVGIPTEHWSWAGPRRNRLADRLLDWLLRDVGNLVVRPHGDDILVEPIRLSERQFFHPQPYRQLAHVLLAQGYEREARYIAVAEQWATPRRCLSRFVHSIYGAGFGFGLSPARALTTLLGYVAVGTVLAAVALRCNMMVETPLIATSTYTTTMPVRTDQAYRAFVSADGKQTRAELSCRDLKPSDALVYAADTVLPFIPLHEETKCELKPDLHIFRLLRALYAMVGWIITSLVLITVSGILKRFDRDGG
jgi:hypothetical protein